MSKADCKPCHSKFKAATISIFIQYYPIRIITRLFSVAQLFSLAINFSVLILSCPTSLTQVETSW